MEKRNLKDLIPYDKNPRKNDGAVDKVLESLMRHGQVKPIVVSEKGKPFKDEVVCAGHTTLRALERFGAKEAFVVVKAFADEAQFVDYNIRDNKVAEFAEWDEALLGELAADFDIDLKEMEFEFDVEEEAQEGLTDEDEVPEAPEEPTAKLGQIWKLGEHRLMCGDSTDRAQVEALMDGEKADMVFTDPPYNTGMTSETQKGQGDTLRKGKKGCGTARLSHMFNDSYTDEEWQAFMDGFCSSYDYATRENCFIFVCLDWRRSHELIPHLKARWKFSNLIIWDKEVHGLGSDYKYTHEFIHVCKKGKPDLAKNKDGEREYQDVWHIQRKIGKDEDHATKKPLEVCERPIRHCSSKGEMVLDLFGGSGSTLIACEKNNRSCRMMELDPKYCDVIIKRFEDFTGKKAELIVES